MIATVLAHTALIEWDSSEEPTLIVAPTYEEAARQAVLAVTGYIAGDDPDFWERHAAELNRLGVLTDDELKALHAEYREAVTVPWVTFDVRRFTGELV